MRNVQGPKHPSVMDVYGSERCLVVRFIIMTSVILKGYNGPGTRRGDQSMAVRPMELVAHMRCLPTHPSIHPHTQSSIFADRKFEYICLYLPVKSPIWFIGPRYKPIKQTAYDSLHICNVTLNYYMPPSKSGISTQNKYTCMNSNYHVIRGFHSGHNLYRGTVGYDAVWSCKW
jgi:hypothetical protein